MTGEFRKLLLYLILGTVPLTMILDVVLWLCVTIWRHYSFVSLLNEIAKRGQQWWPLRSLLSYSNTQPVPKHLLLIITTGNTTFCFSLWGTSSSRVDTLAVSASVSSSDKAPLVAACVPFPLVRRATCASIPRLIDSLNDSSAESERRKVSNYRIVG